MPYLLAGTPLEPLEKACAQGQIPSIVYLYGKETFLVLQGAQFLKEQLIDPTMQDLNLSILQGKELSVLELISTANTLPMMGRARLVIVQHADNLSTEFLHSLSSYIEHPNPTTCLCFLAESADTRIKFFQHVKKQGLMLKLDPLTEKQLPSLMKQIAQSFGVQIHRLSIEALITYVGNNLGQLYQSIEKLSLFVTPGSMIEKTHVELLIDGHPTHTIFEFIDAIGQRKFSRSFGMLEELLNEGDPPLKILAMISRHLRQLCQTQELMEKKQTLSPSALSQYLFIPPFVAGKLWSQAQRIPKKDLDNFHELLYQAEQSMKSSRIDEHHYLAKLVLQICNTST